jgi:DNA gyrase inhibitor GyrI
VDSDTDGTTDQKDIRQFLEQEGKKVIYSTFDSARDILSTMIYPHSDDSDQEDGDDDRKEDGIYDPRETYLLVDECHNMTGDLIDYVKQFSRALLLSATIPEELYDALPIHRIVRIPFSKGIEGNYLVDYTLWLPQLLTKEDGSTEVDTDIPIEFSHHSRDLTAKALYLAVGMLKTGARRCIAYMRTQQECYEFMPILQDVFQNYHGLSVWTEKVTSSVSYRKRTEFLDTFQQEDTEGLFRVLTSVRILDEAVDLPKCDSVFISSIGEQSSDIRFFQRCQRSSTIDPRHPMKRNHIFLWADGWESCVNALQYLRESDPAFHKKMRCMNTRYDGGETKERITREKQETDTVRTWSTVKCMTFEERLIEKGLRLIRWVEEHERAPKQSEEYGIFWHSVKQGRSKAIYDSILSTHTILRSDYEKTQVIKEEKKGKEKQSRQYKYEQLIVWVEEHGRVPKQSEEYGTFWHSIKQGRSTAIYDSLLSTNTILRSDYEKTQVIKEEKKGMTQLSPQEKGELLIVWVEEHERVPKRSEEYGTFWNSVKQDKSKAIYDSILSTNTILRSDYEKTQVIKEEKKGKEKQSPQEKGELLIVWVEEHERVPKYTEEWGVYWYSIKQGRSKAIYDSLLSTHPILRAEYERIQDKKAVKQSP